MKMKAPEGDEMERKISGKKQQEESSETLQDEEDEGYQGLETLDERKVREESHVSNGQLAKR
jgi:hypothetical protein